MRIMFWPKSRFGRCLDGNEKSIHEGGEIYDYEGNFHDVNSESYTPRASFFSLSLSFPLLAIGNEIRSVGRCAVMVVGIMCNVDL